jgi:hypothetical protein
MLQELQDQINYGPFASLTQDGGDGAHGEGVGGHPPGGIGLLQDAADWHVGAVERSDVVLSEKPALEEVVSAVVLRLLMLPAATSSNSVRRHGRRVRIEGLGRTPKLRRATRNETDRITRSELHHLPRHDDLVVSDPLEAGVMAVMLDADTRYLLDRAGARPALLPPPQC